MNRSAIKSWGPAAWTFLHTISFAYPESPTTAQKEEMLAFLMAFASVIPCARCRTDWNAFMSENMTDASSTHLASRDALAHFIVDGHNRVNEKLKRNTYSFSRVELLYTGEQYPINIQRTALILVFGLIVLIIIFCYKHVLLLQEPIGSTGASRLHFR